MKLRQIFEGLGQEVAIIFGRFNPPHKGHRAAWELAAKSPVWYVGTNESTVGPKDPLPYGIKVEAMTAIWPEVEGHIIAETSWLTLASLVYEKHGDVTLLCLTDEDWVTKTIVQYNGKEGAHGFYNFKTIKQKPTPRLSSATALRDAVSKGDREAFATAAGVDADTPVAGKPFFDLVAEYLLPYSNAPVKKVAKKKAAPVESIVREFAADDGDNDEEDTLLKFARMWYKGDDATQQKVEQVLARQGWEIGELESEEGGCFVVKSGDENGNSYIGFAPDDLEEGIMSFMSSEKPKSKKTSSLSAMRKEFEKEKDSNGASYMRSKDLPKKPQHVRTVRAESGEGTPEGLPHLTKTMLTHIVQQVGSEGAHAIIKSLQWGDGASKELLHLIVKDIEDDIKSNDFKQEDAAGVGIITKQNSTVDVNKGTPRKNLKAFKLV
jgi:hypothetical protein